MDNKQRITLDIRDNQTYEQIYTKQYNKGFPLEFEITKDGEPFDLSGCTATFEMKKPDKTVVWKNCDITDNILTVEVTEQMTIVNGKAEFQITLNQGEILITTITGIMKIDKSVIQDGDLESSDQFSIVNEVLLEIKEVKQLVADAKTYKESASTSATNASKSATNASKSATNAKTSETNAKTYATNASTYATNAKTSETNAKTYATNASTYATNAKTSETNAKTSATNASKSASSASKSATNAKTSENNAKTSATNASNSASSASKSATNAKTYAEQAKSISESFSGALRPMGTVTFANLPSLSSASEGDMYNVSDQFTTTTTFKEGSGNVIPAGSNIYKTTDGYWDVLAGSPVTGVKGNAETTYRRGNVNITAANIGALATDGDSSNNIISFESGDGEGNAFVEVPTMSSGETHKSLFAKISTMFKNVRYLFKKLGTTDISTIGDGTVTGGLSTLNSNLSKFGLYDTTAINHGYYNGGYYIEWFFADNNKYRLVSTLNDIALTYWDGKEWTTKWSLNSNLTTNNYYYNSGVVLDDGDGGYIEGGGTVTMTIVGNIARIDFSIRINKNNTPSDFDSVRYGINRDLLVNLGFQKVTPLTGGSFFYYGSDGTIKNDMTYMGGIFEHFYDEYWTPSRIYDEQYVGGAWQSRVLPVSLIMRGTCYGRVE